MEIILLAETKIDWTGKQKLLEYMGAPDWHTDARSDADELTEICGRLCYRAFGVGLNPNVTKVREGNDTYVGNILKQKHGSVMEHSSTTLAFMGVSRILTHELVRHRPGMAYSQESMRFVRLTDYDVYMPGLEEPFVELAKIVSPGGSSEDDKIWAYGMIEQMVSTEQLIKQNIQQGFKFLNRYLDDPNVPFHLKKTITSAMRRLIPGGVKTNIIVTANHRAWRHLIENRTSEGAEVEIREAFWEVGKIMENNYPALYQDIRYDAVGSSLSMSFDNSKV